jgi:Domain of unknown function (DUF309)
VTLAMSILALPRWAHVPGAGGEADHAPLALAKAEVPARFDRYVPASHPAVIYGLQLNNAGFFWEAHEVLEAVWKAAPQGGLDRICLRGCIQIANANLKLTMGRRRATARLIAEAAAEFVELDRRRPKDGDGSFACGFPAVSLATQLHEAMERPEIVAVINIGP